MDSQLEGSPLSAPVAVFYREYKFCHGFSTDLYSYPVWVLGLLNSKIISRAQFVGLSDHANQSMPVLEYHHFTDLLQ